MIQPEYEASPVLIVLKFWLFRKAVDVGCWASHYGARRIVSLHPFHDQFESCGVLVGAGYEARALLDFAFQNWRRRKKEKALSQSALRLINTQL